MTGKLIGNTLAKQRKKEHDDSALVFPKIANLTGDMILQHQLDDTYTRTSYSIHFDQKDPGKPISPLRRCKPPPQTDFLSWQHAQNDATNINEYYGKVGAFQDSQYNRFEADYTRGYRHVPYSPIQRQRLLNREEITKVKFSEMEDAEVQMPSTPLPSPVATSNQPNGVDCYSNLNKFLGTDILRDKEVLSEVLDSADKRYLLKLLHTLSPETLLGLKKWLMARDEDKEKEDSELTRWPPISPSPCSSPSTPTKEQENASNEPTIPTKCLEKRAPSFNKIFEKAPAEEKDVIRKLLTAGDQKYLEKFLSSVVRPEVVPGVQYWLINHEGQDREVAIRFLGDIRKPVRLMKEMKDENVDVALLSGKGQTLKRVREKKRSPHGSNCSCAICDTDHSNKILKALYKHGTTAIIDEMRKALDFVPRPRRTVTRKQSMRKNQVAKLGGENLGQNTITHTSYVANKGALFMQPHRAIPSYFVIHPEMP